MRAIALAISLATLLVAKGAAAEDLRLSWRAPAGCPGVEHVRDAALRNAGSDAALEPLDADAQVEHGERWRVTIRTSRSGTPAAERQLEAASCAALADATAVILAIAMIPPGRAEVSVDVDVDADAKANANAGTPVVAAAASDRDRGRGRNVRAAYGRGFALSVAGTSDATTLPAAALGGRLALAWTSGRLRVEVGGSYFLGQSKTTERTAAGARFTLLVAGGRACWALLQDVVEIAPCAGLDVQSMTAKGFGAVENYDANGAWMSAGPGGLVRLPIASWFALRADADAVVPFTRPRFVVEGDGAVHRPSPLGVRAGIGAELLFL